jgi:hypothetical protein
MRLHARIALLASIALANAPTASARQDRLEGSASVREPYLLASYSFEDETPTGPDTFRIFEYGRGTVKLTTAYHVSGYRAIEIRDVANDKSMPEIQGYFPLRKQGRLFAHFSFLTATPQEQFNIALAGPTWFKLEKDGIAFWLQGKNGRLFHYSDNAPRALFDLQPFVWYTADVTYDIDAGTYDLTIQREGESSPLVSLLRQRNGPNARGSAVDKFSFVGEPFGDASNVTYYVDDIVIGIDERIRQRPFVAPGRRKLFLDWFAEYEKREREKVRCVPALGVEDLGLTDEDARTLAGQGLLGALEELLGPSGPDMSRRLQGNARLDAVALWSTGCRALEDGRPKEALAHFASATEKSPQGRIYELSAILALVRLGRFVEADERIGIIYSDWRDDPRYAVVSAIVGSARGDLDKAEAWLREPAERAALRYGDPALRAVRSGRITRDAIASLKEAFPGEWREHLTETLVSEQYYYVLLWRGRYDAARDYALRMADRFRALSLPVNDWRERAADAIFYAKGLAEAREIYEGILAVEPRWPVILKLSDLAFLTGDLERERALREQYFGVLEGR